MFPGPAAGGLVAGPTTGAINTNPAAYIPDNGLAIDQINELRGELAQKHPLLTESAQNLVTNLTNDLGNRATNQQLADGLAQKRPLLTESATLAQNLVTNLTHDLGNRATNQQLADGLAQKHPLITATATLPQALVTD